MQVKRMLTVYDEKNLRVTLMFSSVISNHYHIPKTIHITEKYKLRHETKKAA